MLYKPGSTYWGEFTTRRFDTGVRVDADSLPTATMVKNGTDDGTVTLTVTDKGTGNYSVTGTIPVGYAAGDVVAIRVTATVNSVTDHAIIETFVLDSARPGEVYTRLGAPSGASIAADVAGVQSDTNDIQTRLPAALVSGKMDSSAVVSDKTGFSLTTGEHTAIQADADAALAARGVTSARQGYLDNLNIGGLVASQSEVTSVQNNTRVVRTVPSVIERPDSGTLVIPVELLLYDAIGNMEAPDAAPTLAVTNQAGTSRNDHLDSTTLALVSTGRYKALYTVQAADTLEPLYFTFSVVEGGATRVFSNVAVLVDTSAVDFTAADRTKLERLDTDLTTARAAKLDFLTGAVALEASITALKGAGWTNESLKAIYDQVILRLLTSGYTAPDNAGIGSIQTVTNKLSDMITGASPDYAFDTAALANAPAGGGGGGTTDWTSDERSQIRYRLGIDGTEAAPSSNSPNLGTVDANVVSMESNVVNADALAADAVTELQAGLSAPSVDDIEEHLANLHGAGQWGPSGAAGSNTVTLTVIDEDTTDPLPSARVTVKNQAGTVILDQKYTNADGQATFDLDNGNYLTSVSGLPSYSSIADEPLSVPAALSDTYALAPLLPDVAAIDTGGDSPYAIEVA